VAARDRLIQVALDAITATRLSLRAKEAGVSMSAYVADLIARDGDQGLADALAVEQLEMQLLTAILLRALLAGIRGEEIAASLTARAREKAVDQSRSLLAHLRASGFRS
jgi:hypothetical protein